MNTIVAEMPRADISGRNVAKGKGPEDGKQMKFDEVLKGQKEQHTAEKDKHQEPDKEDKAKGLVGTEMLNTSYVLEAPQVTGNLYVMLTEMQENADHAAEARGVPQMDGKIAALPVKGADSQANHVPVPVLAAGGGENPEETAVNAKGDIPNPYTGLTQDDRTEGLQAAAKSMEPQQTEHKPDRTEPAVIGEESDRLKMDAAAAKYSDPVHRTSENVPIARDIQTSPKPALNEDIRTEYMDRLKMDIVKQIASGKQQLEVQLHPKHLGTMVIKASYEAGKAVISIVCSEAKTMQVMSQQARELAGIMEARTGNETEVIVERPADDYLQQQQQEQSGRGQDREPDRQQREHHKGEFRESFDFLQQLRLGLA